MRAKRFAAGPAVPAVPVLVALAMLVAGCGGSAPGATGQARTSGPLASLHRLFPGMHLRYGGAARLTPAAPPRSTALPGASDLLAAGRVVLAATDLGIWRSADGGTSWRQVLSGAGIWSLSAVRGAGYAAIGNLPATDRLGPAVLATSADGVHWRMLRVRAPRSSPIPLGYGYRIALSGFGSHAVGIAVPDVDWTFFTPPSLRSGDGGRTWTPIGQAGPAGALPRGASTGLAMTGGGRTVFVTAPGPGGRCAGAVYRSFDAGVTWSLLRGSCEPYPLLAVQFISPRQGFAAGGLPEKFGGAQVVEETSDGGLTWRTTWRTTVQNGRHADSGIVRLDMVSARNGWALTGGCVGGQNGPCGGTVYSTHDGGLRWYRTGQGATSVTGLGSGGSRALAGDDFTATLAITTNGGRTWSRQTRPAWIRTSGFAGAGRSLAWASNLGDYLSADAGAHWASADQLSAPRFGYEAWLAGPPGRLLGFAGSGSLTTVVSSDSGRTWTTSRVPDRRSGDMLLTAALGTGGTAIAVTGAGAQCVSRAQVQKTRELKPGWKPPPGRSALFTSTDGGSRWSRAGVVLPFGVGYPAAATADGSHLAIIDACNRLQVSSDAGGHWRGEAIRKSVFCAVSALSAQSWLACQSGPAGFWLLHSADGGSTWTAFRLPAAAVANGMYSQGLASTAALGVGGIAATGAGSAVMPAGGSIWLTTDGGRSWAQSWPALSCPQSCDRY